MTPIISLTRQLAGSSRRQSISLIIRGHKQLRGPTIAQAICGRIILRNPIHTIHSRKTPNRIGLATTTVIGITIGIGTATDSLKSLRSDWPTPRQSDSAPPVTRKPLRPLGVAKHGAESKGKD